MHVDELGSGGAPRWDEYVCRSRETGFFHLAGWKRVLERTYGHETRYLYVEDKGEIKGVLPLFILRHRLFGTQVSSLSGAIAADNPTYARALLDAGTDLADSLNADHLLLGGSTRPRDGELITSQHYCTHKLALPADARYLWQKFPSKLRNKIRRAEKEGMTATVDGAQLLETFYDLFSRNLHNLGTPVFEKQLLVNIMAEFPQQARIFAVCHDGQAIGTMFLFLFKDTVYDQWAASSRDYFRLRVNELLYWKALSWASDQGYRCFDFGRSRWDSGPYHFKQKWGATACPLYYQYYLRKGLKIPDFGLTAERVWTHRLFFRAWQFLPLGLTRVIGPYLRKQLYPL